MKPLMPPDWHRFCAADGWHKLGDSTQARLELEGLSPEARTHPDVLQLLWRLTAEQGQWAECRDLAISLTQVAPQRRFGWLHLAYSLHQLGEVTAAYDTLSAVVDNFEPNATIPFHLARYACRLGRFKLAHGWLDRAYLAAAETGMADDLRQKVLGELDLEPLWGALPEVN